MERFANNADSTLVGAIDNDDTTIVVADGSPFPSVGNFRLIFGGDPDTAEYVIATARTGNTLTVIRGQEGTSAQSWTDGTTVTHILTKGAVEELRDTLKGKTLHSSLETIDGPQDGYALTWVNVDGYWAARPGSQWTTANASEIYTTKTVSIDGNGTLASTHGDGSSKLYVNGKILGTSFSAGEIPLTTQGFGYISDTLQTFTVPAGVTTLKVKMWGPGGGTGSYSGSGGGGPGGFTTGLLSVTPGEVLQLAVGSGGKKPTTNSPGPGGLGGWPGGGFGTGGDASGGGGGGFTGIFNTSITQANALMIAGGGGGATGFGSFGAGGGGGLIGGSGAGSSGKGGTQTIGGADGNGQGAPSTTIAVASNGAILPQGTINVASTTGFPTAGIIYVTTSTGAQTVNYTGTTGTTFTGCTGGTGTMSTGGAVGGGVATIAAGSNGASLPQGTINVSSTTGFPTAGILLVFTSAGYQIVRYTGTGATTFTGCTGGTGTMSTGGTVTLASAGSVFTGGIAFSDRTSFQPTGDDCGGGGSGYWGGGSGKSDGRHGGGGSGFMRATRVTSGVTTTGANAGAGNTVTLPPSTTDVNYIAGIGVGAAASGASGTDGGDGYIFFIWGGITTLDFDSIDFGNTSTISTIDTNMTIAPATNGTLTLSAGGASGAITLAPTSGLITLSSAATDISLTSGTSSVLFNMNSAQKFKIYSSGAVVVGGADAQNDTSAEAQAGLTGPLINIGSSTGALSTVANQATIFNQAGILYLQGNTDLRFATGSTTKGSFDSNGIFRFGPSSTSTLTAFGATYPLAASDIGYGFSSSSSWLNIFSSGTTTRSALSAYNTSAGGSATSGVSIQAPGSSHATAGYSSNGIIEHAGSATSGIVFASILGTGASTEIKGRIWRSGAWSIGDNTQNDTSAEAQAGLTGALINLSTATGTFTSTTNQALNFNIGGAHHIQGNTEVRFDIAANLAGYFDSNRTFRIGPSAATSATTFGGTALPVSTDAGYGYSAAGDHTLRYASGSTSGHAFIDLLNTAGGASTMVMMRMAAGGTASGVTAWQGNGLIEQGGAATSCIVYTATNNVGAGRITTGRMYQSGAWCIGDSVINDTSAEAQAGLTGPLLNLTQITGSSLTSTANQALVYNSAGVNTLQGHVGHALVANTTTVASTSTTKFVTNVGRRVNTVVTTTNLGVSAGTEVVIVGSLSGSITVTLPSGPTAGDIYTVKDQAGGAVTNNIIVSGNGNNIDGAATYTINTNYQSITVVFANGTWSII